VSGTLAESVFFYTLYRSKKLICKSAFKKKIGCSSLENHNNHAGRLVLAATRVIPVVWEIIDLLDNSIKRNLNIFSLIIYYSTSNVGRTIIMSNFYDSQNIDTIIEEVLEDLTTAVVSDSSEGQIETTV